MSSGLASSFSVLRSNSGKVLSLTKGTKPLGRPGLPILSRLSSGYFLVHYARCISADNLLVPDLLLIVCPPLFFILLHSTSASITCRCGKGLPIGLQSFPRALPIIGDSPVSPRLSPNFPSVQSLEGPRRLSKERRLLNKPEFTGVWSVQNFINNRSSRI